MKTKWEHCNYLKFKYYWENLKLNWKLKYIFLTSKNSQLLIFDFYFEKLLQTPCIKHERTTKQQQQWTVLKNECYQKN